MQQPKYNLSIKFVCNKCGKQFTGENNLQRHILLKHENNWQQMKYCESGNNSAGLGMLGVYCHPASLRLSPTRICPIPAPLSESQLSNRTVKSLHSWLDYINPNFGGSPQY